LARASAPGTEAGAGEMAGEDAGSFRGFDEPLGWKRLRAGQFPVRPPMGVTHGTGAHGIRTEEQ